jgi:lipopolysaccharide export system protein LptA
MLIPPAEPEEGDDRALKVVKKSTTRVATEDVEYFWGRDFILTHGPTRVEQEDRLALADQIVYWGDEKQVLLDGNITMVQGDGRWLVDEELVEVDNHDMRRAVTSYSELYAARAVVYLNNNDFIASGNVMVRQDEREVAADVIVYQDEIKRISADGNVKFWDKDDQQFICSSLVFHSDSDFMEVQGGALATMRLPAKFANDINRTLAEVREEPAPAEIADPPVSEEVPTRDPNRGSTIASGVRPVAPSGPPPIGPLPIPSGNGESPEAEPVMGPPVPQELLLELGEDEPASEPAGGGAAEGEELS